MDLPSFWSIQHIIINVHIATAALCAYEHILTLPQEIKLIWQPRKMSLASILFLVNRYAFLCYSGFGLVAAVSWDPSDPDLAALTLSDRFMIHLRDQLMFCFSCDVVVRLNDVCMIMMYLVLAVFAATRTYAIWDKNKIVFACVLGLGLQSPLGYIYRLTRQVYHPYPYPIPGCSAVTTLPFGFTPRIGWDTLFCLLGLGINVLFELVVIILTWTKTLPAVLQLRQLNKNMRPSVSYIIFRNGTFHFLAMLFINICGLPQFIPMIASDQAGHVSQSSNLQVSEKAIVTALIEAVTSIVISRFILDLKEDALCMGQDGVNSLDTRDISFHLSPEALVRYSVEGCGDLEGRSSNISDIV